MALRDWLEEATAQINPFDKGKTAASVRATRPVAPPAQLPSQNRPQQPQQQRQIKILQPPKQNFLDKFKDVLGANTDADKYRRQQAGLPEDYSKQSTVSKVTRALESGGRSVARAAQGVGQDLGGAYDLVTPGVGENRITKMYRDRGAQTDKQVDTMHLDPNAYRAGQVAPTVASYFVPGKVVEGVSKIPTIARGAEVASTVINKVPGVARAAGVLDDLAANGNAVQRVTSRLAQSYTKAPNIVDVVADTIQNAGHRTSLGQDNSPLTFAQDAGASLAMQGATNLGGQGVQATSKLVTTPLRNANLIRPVNINPTEVAALNRFQDARKGLYEMDNSTYQQGVQAAKKAGIDYRDSNSVDGVLGAFRHYDTQKGNRKENLMALKKAMDDNASLGMAAKPIDSNGNPVSNFQPRPLKERLNSLKSSSPLEQDMATVEVLPKSNPNYQPKEIPEYIPPANPSPTPTRTDFPDENRLNTGRLNLDEASRKTLDEETISVIDNISHKDIEKMARSAGMDTKTYSIDQTKKKIAEQLNVRKDTVRLMNEARAAQKSGDRGATERLILQAAEQGRVSSSQGADLARQLSARRIIANELDTPEQRIFKLLDKAGVNPETYARRLADVDFSNPKDVVKAYRELVPAKFGNWLDTIRYNSMLSSPLTQAVNVFGNAQNVAVVAPIEKTLRGSIDAIGGLFGGKREYAAGEGVAYAGGVAKNIKNASENFVDALRGTGKYSNPDLEEYSMPLATSGAKGAAYNTLSAPMKVLDGMDKFFRTLAEGGEEAALTAREKAGIAIKGNRTALKSADADYRVFQTPLGEPGQGMINNAFDEFAKLAMKGRSSKNPIMATISKFTIPFVKTVNNIAKQGIVDYSPLGFVNLKGASDKKTALTRAIMGSAVFGTSAAMIASGDMTWAEPRDPDERARFRAEGRQPYAIKVGGKWVNFSKLTPAVAFPMAMTAALHDAVESKTLDQSNVDAILEAVSKYGNFLSDQSYAKSLGDTLAAIGGDKEAIASSVANNVQQLVPFRALTGWVARMGDDVERKVDTSRGYFDQQVQALMQQYPGLRQKTDTRDYRGEPIAANNPVFNGISPVRVTDDRGVNPLDAEMDKLSEANQSDPLLNSSQKKEVAKRVDSQLSKMQQELINTPEYQNLSEKDKQSRLNKIKSDLGAVERKNYMAEKQVGEYAQDFKGKESKLTSDQRKLASGNFSSSRYATSSDSDKDFATQYEDAVTKFKADEASLSNVQKRKQQKDIAQLKVKKDFDKDSVDLYGMSKSDVYELISNDPDGKSLAQKMLAYGDALVNAGLEDKNKFRDKYGNEAIKPKEKGSGGGKGKKIKAISLYSGGSNPLTLSANMRKLIANAKIGGKSK